MDNQAEAYGWKGSSGTYSASYLQNSLSRIIGNNRYDKLADIGTGNGYNLRFLSQFCTNLVGFEPDSDGVHIASKENPGILIHQLGVYDQPDETELGTFDCAVSLEVAEHLFNPHSLPIFACKLLKPGGKLIISTPFHGYWKNLALALSGKWDFHHHPLRVGGHIKFFSNETIRKLLESNGFEIESINGSGRFPPFWCSTIAVAKKL